MPDYSSRAELPSIKGQSQFTRMALLTFSLVGLQFTWGMEMTYCTPYLLSLGLTKSRTSLVWIAGPLSGLIMQPLIGVLADRSTSPYGRRRPFMICGSFAVCFCLLLLGWTSEVVSFFIDDPVLKKPATVFAAVLSIYGIDFSINVVQASCRSLVVDVLPIPEQHIGSAWATRMCAAGHLVGYWIGSIDMVSTFGTFLGETQFKQLSMISGLSLLFCVGVTCWGVKEKPLLPSKKDNAPNQGVSKAIGQLFETTRRLPPRIKAICHVQFWSWIGWFPFLFYGTTWVGETYYRYEAPANETPEDMLGEIGRIGSTSLVYYSGVTFFTSVILPRLVLSTQRAKSGRYMPLFISRSLAKITSFFPVTRPSIPSTWMIAHVLFALFYFHAPWIKSLRMASFIVAISGIPSAICSWASFALMGIEINRLTAASPVMTGRRSSLSTRSPSSRIPNPGSPTGSLYLDEKGDSEDDTGTTELAGIYLGVLNIYTTLPQFTGTLIGWLVFSILEPGATLKDETHSGADNMKRREGPNAISVCLFIGAICALVATEATRRLKKQMAD